MLPSGETGKRQQSVWKQREQGAGLFGNQLVSKTRGNDTVNMNRPLADKDFVPPRGYKVTILNQLPVNTGT